MMNSLSANPVLVEFTRGALVESKHRGAIAIAEAGGQLRLGLGDLDTPVFPRSAIKMIQALPMIETGAADAFKVSARELALASASHSGEPEHVQAVSDWLGRLQCTEADLVCGPHLPLADEAAKALITAREKPCRLHNNCSGKHTGFLTLARFLGAPVADYVGLTHPVQVLVRQTLADLTGLDAASLPWGIDGCAAPNFAVPLSHLATGFARLADPVRLSRSRAAAARRLTAATQENAFFVAGTGRPCTQFMDEAAGRVSIKMGAEGVYCAALSDLGLGVAIKMDDGGGRGAETVMAAVLAALRVISAQGPAASRYLNAPVKNWRGDETGRRRPARALAELMERGLRV